MSDIKVSFGGVPVVVQLGENSQAALAASERAVAAAAAATALFKSTDRAGTIAQRGAIPTNQLTYEMEFHVNDIVPPRTFVWRKDAAGVGADDWVGLPTPSEASNLGNATGVLKEENAPWVVGGLAGLTAALSNVDANSIERDGNLRNQVDSLKGDIVGITSLTSTPPAVAAGATVASVVLKRTVTGNVTKQYVEWDGGKYRAYYDPAATDPTVPPAIATPTSVLVIGSSLSIPGKWVEAAAAAAGLTIKNAALYASTSRKQALRVGAFSTSLTLASGTLPAAGTEGTVTLINGAATTYANADAILHANEGDADPAGHQISGMLGGRHVTIIHRPATAPNVYKIFQDAGGAALAIPDGSEFVPDWKADLATSEIWGDWGQNGYDVPEREFSNLDAILRLTRSPRILLSGVLNDATQGTGTAGLAAVKAYNAQFKARYPQYYLEMRTALLAAGGSTGDDAADRANEIIPRSQRTTGGVVDSLHPGTAGNTTWANTQIAARTEKGAPGAIGNGMPIALTVADAASGNSDTFAFAYGQGVTSTERGKIASALQPGTAVAALSETSSAKIMTSAERKALGEWRTPSQAPVSGAYIAKGTGQPVSLANYQYVDYDRVGDESGLRFSAYVLGTVVSAAVYLDASGQLISGANEFDGTGSGVQFTNQALNPPANWAKVRITGRSDAGRTIQIQARRPSEDTAERVTATAAALVAAQVDLATVKGTVAGVSASLSEPGAWTTPAQAVVTGSYISSSNGTPVALANYQYVKIALTGQETGVRATALLLGTVTALAVYYDAANAFISAEVLGTASSVQYTNYVLSPPANARYVAITGRDSSAVSVQTRGSVTAPNVASRVSAAEQNITELVGAVDGFDGAIDEVVSSLSRPGEWTTPAQAPVANYYINRANGAPIALANYQYVKVPLTGSEVGVRASAYVAGTVIALAVYYDAANAFISAEVLGTASGVQYTNYVLSPPANARYVAITGRSDNSHTVQVQTRIIEVASGVAADLQTLQAEFDGASSGLGTTDLCMFGDSQTEASSGYGDDLAALYPERTAYNQGIGGQTLPMIAARMGANPVTLTAPVVIPTSGSVAIAYTGLSIDLLRRTSGTAVIKVLLAGVECALAFDSAAASGAGGYTLTPLDYPPAAVNAASGTRVEVLTGFVFGTDPATCPPLGTVLGGVVCIRAGRNSINGAGIDLAPLYRLIDAMVTQARRYTDKIILIGQLLGYVDLPTSMSGEGGVRATAELSYAIINNCVQLNAYQRRTYAAWFFDAHQYHVDRNGAQSRTITPNGVNKTYNILTIGAASPKLADGLHENTAVGQPETAQGVAEQITARKL